MKRVSGSILVLCSIAVASQLYAADSRELTAAKNNLDRAFVQTFGGTKGAPMPLPVWRSALEEVKKFVNANDKSLMPFFNTLKDKNENILTYMKVGGSLDAIKNDMPVLERTMMDLQKKYKDYRASYIPGTGKKGDAADLLMSLAQDIYSLYSRVVTNTRELPSPLALLNLPANAKDWQILGIKESEITDKKKIRTAYLELSRVWSVDKYEMLKSQPNSVVAKRFAQPDLKWLSDVQRKQLVQDLAKIVNNIYDKYSDNNKQSQGYR